MSQADSMLRWLEGYSNLWLTVKEAWELISDDQQWWITEESVGPVLSALTSKGFLERRKRVTGQTKWGKDRGVYEYHLLPERRTVGVLTISEHRHVDWCHFCGKRKGDTVDIWQAENAEHDQRPAKYVRMCRSCADEIKAFMEAHPA